MDRCPLTLGHDVTRHFHLPVLIAFWVMYPLPLHSMYIHREEYATNQDDTESTASEMQPTLSWAVKFRTSNHRKIFHRTDYDEIAHRIAKEISLLNHGQVGELLNHYLFVHASYNQTLNGTDERTDLGQIQQEIENKLREHPDVEWFHQQRIRRRTKRSLNFKDPSYSMQWHLHNHKSPGMDINVTEVWNHNITGTGVVVAVIDDGLEWRNEDILANYNAMGSWDLNNNDPDPMPEVHKDEGKSLNRHGTRCAGEIAAVANDKCSVGVAFNAQISGIRLLDGPMTDSLEATAFNKNMHINDIYSCSWGPDDDGKTVDGPHPLAQAALKHGVTAGRKGLGSIFVVASGNGGRNEDNCNYDGYANSMYTVTIGAVDESGQMPYYAEQCASMLAVTFSSGAANKRNIVTTDWTLAKGTGCTSSHTGTSAAAPLAAGMIALMLQAKPCLTWRDIQHIIIYTAVRIDEKNAVWITNTGGFHHSHKHGFGLMSAWRLVNAAKAWHTVPWLTSVDGDIKTVNKPILAGKTLTLTQMVSNATAEQFELRTLEHVLVTVTLTHTKRGMLKVQLICPSGTESVIGASRKKDDSSEGLKSWTFSTVRCWGENPVGDWKLVLSDNHPGNFNSLDVNKGQLQTWKLTLYGSNMNRREIEKRKILVSEAMSGIFLDANLTEPCSYYWNAGYEDVNYLSSRAMEILLYVSGVFTLMAIYYTLEQAFCNSEDKGKNKEEGGDSEDLERGPHERFSRGDSEERMHLLEEIRLEMLSRDEVCVYHGRYKHGEDRHLMDEHSMGGDEVNTRGDRVNTRGDRVGQEHLLRSDEVIRNHRHICTGGNGEVQTHLRGDEAPMRLTGDEVHPGHDAKRVTRLAEHIHRDDGDGDSDHGTSQTSQNDQVKRSPVIHCSCEVDAEATKGIPETRDPPVPFNVRSIRTHCHGCHKNQVQYNVPIRDFDSKLRDSRESHVPASKEVPSQNALPFASCQEVRVHPLLDRNPSLTNGRSARMSHDLPLVGLNRENPSTQTAGQFAGSTATHPSADTDNAHASLEATCPLAVSADQPLTQPIPSGLLLSAMSGVDKSNTRRNLIGPSICKHGNKESYSDTNEPRSLYCLTERTFEEQTRTESPQDNIDGITDRKFVTQSMKSHVTSTPPFFQD